MKPYLTLTDAVEIIPVAPITLRRAIKRGDLPAYKPAGRLLVREDHLEAWIESRQVTTDPMPQPERKPDSFLDQVRHDRQEAA